jgi:hypothetical protein
MEEGVLAMVLLDALAAIEMGRVQEQSRIIRPITKIARVR